MYTVCFPIGGGYVGQVWKAPVLFDGLFSWDNMSPYDFGGVLGPAFWCHTVEAMSGAASPTDHWMEWDWEDIGAEISGVSDHWMDAGVPQGAGIGAGWPQHLLMQAGEYHRISGLYLTIASNGGWGIFMSFFDGQFIAYTDVLYTSSTNLPALTNPNAGLFSAFESLHLPIMIDTGNRTSGVGNSGGWPMYIDWVKVYTK